MPATFNLELIPGQHIAIDTTCTSDELDMSKGPDGNTVAGVFWGKLDIVHNGDDHSMEFTGTRLNEQEYPPEMMFDSRVVSKLTVAAKPPTARCHLSVLSPQQTYCDITLSFAPLWSVGTTYPEAEPQEGNRVKWFVRLNPGGVLEHFNSETVVSELYYEALWVFQCFTRVYTE